MTIFLSIVGVVVGLPALYGMVKVGAFFVRDSQWYKRWEIMDARDALCAHPNYENRPDLQAMVGRFNDLLSGNRIP
jgi:hypothetical protein